MWKNTRKGYWSTDNIPILCRSINDENNNKTGYASFSDVYAKLYPK